MQAVRTIQARPSRSSRWQKQGGWELYEGDGVSPMSCGPSGREDALSYARQRAGYARQNRIAQESVRQTRGDSRAATNNSCPELGATGSRLAARRWAFGLM